MELLKHVDTGINMWSSWCHGESRASIGFVLVILGTATRLRPIPGGQRAAPDFSSTSSSLHAADVSRTLVNKKGSARGERCGHHLIRHHSTLTGQSTRVHNIRVVEKLTNLDVSNVSGGEVSLGLCSKNICLCQGGTIRAETTQRVIYRATNSAAAGKIGSFENSRHCYTWTIRCP